MTEEEIRLAAEKKAAEEKAAADKKAAEEAEAKAAQEAAEKLKADPLIAKALELLVGKELADIKEKLNGAYSARDEANKQLAKLAEEKRLADIQALKDAGKHVEAAAAELAAVKAENEALKNVNTNLSRDNGVKDAIKGLDFRSTKASDTAFKEIVDQLVRNEQGQWVHKTGVSIDAFITAFSKDEENSYLFKPKASSGSGSSSQRNTNTNDGSTSLFKKSQAEVLALAAAGQLPQRRK